MKHEKPAEVDSSSVKKLIYVFIEYVCFRIEITIIQRTLIQKSYLKSIFEKI